MKIIMITGLPGTGKSTFAQTLAGAIGARHLNTDIIRDAMGKRGQYDADTKAIIYAEMLRQTGLLLENDTDVIIDGTFYQKKLRQPYILLAKKYKAAMYWIETAANEEVIRERVSCCREYSEADFAVYLQIKSQYEPLNIPHLVLHSDQLSIAEMLENAVNYLKNNKLKIEN
ncbi:MAG: AAA family ATPase [Saprospiraceae bacterium]